MANLFEPDAVEASVDHIDEILCQSESQVRTFLMRVPVPIGEVAAVSLQY